MPSHTPYVLLTSGTYHGSGWQLFGWEQEGHLCLEALPSGSDPAHLPAASKWQSGGCQFDSNPSAGYYVGGSGPAGSTMSYGPLSADATQIRVATRETLTTVPLPTSKGLPTGRYWIHIMPARWPTAADGLALDTPQPLNSRNEPVSFQNF